MKTADHAADIGRWQEHFEGILDHWLPGNEEQPGELHEAMRYSALAGGKRFRPVLVYASGQALGIEQERLDPVAASIELIHAYSLIHDDLPAMDNDDMRRGRPSCHKAFDEATAILAGDALQALAFDVLAAGLPASEPASLAVIREIARACGSTGMAGGQALDLGAVGHRLDESALTTMHQLKTGALIRASVTAPCIMAQAAEQVQTSMAAYGDCVGLAFQVHDDILDVTGDSALIGKNTQADDFLDKPTFPSILGLAESQQHAARLRDEAIAHLDHIPGDTTVLAWLADYVVSRDR